MSENGPTYTIDDLIRCGRRALEEYSNVDHQLSAIEAYAAVFDRLFKAGNVNIPTVQADEVQEVHSRVLDLAETLRGDVSGSLKELMVKGKATLKYVDHLPKRISVTKPQVG